MSYIILSSIILIILLIIGNFAINKSFKNKSQKKTKKRLLFSGLLVWHVYLFFIGNSGFLSDLSFPPRYMLFVILPLFIFIGVFLKQNKNKKWVQVIPYTWLTFYQSLRIFIETIFVYTVAAGILHKNVTIKGYNYDLIYSLTSIIMGLIVYKSKSTPKTLLLIWNYLGLAFISIIILLFITSIYSPHFFGPNTTNFPTEFGFYPYVLIPGFLMPSAVFIHVLSIIKLKNNTNG